MKELRLTHELFDDIVLWMQPKYALGTISNRIIFLRKIFKEYKVLSHDTLKRMMKKFKYQHQRACITMINNYCYDNDIDFNIIIPSIKKQANKLPDILSPAEIKLMISAVTSPYDLAIRCIFNMGAGLRISEIIKFSWDHIRWIDWLSNQENYGVAIIKSGKGSKDRIVNIPKNLMKDLYAYAKEQDVLDEFRIPHGNAIFKFGSNTYSENRANKMNKVLAYDKELGKFKTLKSRYNWFRYNILGKECEKALHKHIKIHSLRHSKATYLYEVEKVPIEKIQILLGHSSINTTMLYTKINPKSVFDMLKDTNEI
jgi:integrase